MDRPTKLRLPMTLSFVVLATATVTGSWGVACGGGTSSTGSTSSGGMGGSTSSTTSDSAFCLPDADAGPNQKCPDMLDAGEKCPPGCHVEVV
jgi:hypothetical protein